MFKQIIFSIELLSCLAFCTTAQTITLSGYITDAESGERLIGASIFEGNTAKGIASNEQGFYSLSLKDINQIQLIVSYIGYQTDTISLAPSDNHLDIELQSIITLNTLEVSASDWKKEYQKTQMSEIDVLVKDIKQVPAILGEVDIIKVLQMMPGVQAGSEGLSGLYVRGGSPDQNLVLLDGVPIYNPSHVLGIFSVFNADAIKNVSLIKGGFPARYGGRLSSILNVNMKDGNLNKIQGEGSISTIAAKLTLEGPIQKGKTSFLLSVRRSYIDQLLKPIIRSQSGTDELTAFFYDFNAKIRHIINDKNSLTLSFYNGKDLLKTRFKNHDLAVVYGGTLSWQNNIAALRWNYKLNNKTFLNTTLYTTNYQINISEYVESDDLNFESIYTSGIKDFAARSILEFIPSTRHYIRLGGHVMHHTYQPGAMTFNLNSTTEVIDTSLGTQKEKALEYNFFAEDEWNINPKLSLNVGLHFSGFQVEEEEYTSLQPRLSLRYQIQPKVGLKASFATMTQYINLLSSETLGLPSDLWVPSTKQIQPQQSWQIAGGISTIIKEQYSLTIEGFYKKMKNVISYTEGAQFIPNIETDWQENVVQGNGEVYGLEFLLNKKMGKTSGWIGYTLSWNWRQFDAINGGERYPFRYDRRHDVAIVVQHQQNERISYSFSWVYGTGNAITIPIARYAVTPDYQQNIPPLLQETAFERFVTASKNNYRMSAFHRLDASVSFFKKKERFERKWIFGVYNIYSHVNPYYIAEDTEIKSEIDGGVEYNLVLKEIGLLPIIPSIAYSFKF